MNIYIINLDEGLAAKIQGEMVDKGVYVKVFNRVNNLTGFSSVSGDSMLIIGQNYQIDNYLDCYNQILEVSNNPISFIVDKSRYQNISLELKGANQNGFLVFEESDAILDEIAKAYTNSKNMRVRKSPLSHNDILLDMDNFLCSSEGTNINLTKTQINILYYLMASVNSNVSHENIMTIFDIQGKKVNFNTIVSHVRNIKNKIYSVTGNKEFIKSIYGFGYRL